MSVKRILFVCTGNSCRSVMAAGLMRQVLERAGFPSIQVESAGVFAINGMGPTRETLRVLQDIGVDCSDHRARVLTADMVDAADLIFVMEPFQGEEVLRRQPSAKGKVHLLKPYGLPPGAVEGQPGIPDPIGKPLEIYEVCFNEIRQAVERIAKSLGVNAA
ncbi:MAG: protein tyrosine phosphatase [Candidatus Omnitrophica bacterium CG11_big_fil_rev_8_21_14_0_20_63_9]|nr:MAG: protein tyrosine phosphatase [Candidatus Omnitrophica bacterium CG11_big_fil_rev_8_21_14_0_20_63_9]